MKILKGKLTSVLWPKLLSHALAIVWSLFVLSLTLMAIISGDRSRLIRIFEIAYPGYGFTPAGVIIGLIWAYVYAYLFGFLIAYLYTRSLPAEIRDAAKSLFEIDPDKKVNLLQKGQGKKPYTIVFIANPVLWMANSHQRDDEIVEFQRDPVIEDPLVFYKTVLRCLRSFAANELLRKPEIISKMRLITIFDTTPARIEPKEENALCEDLDMLTTVLAPRKNQTLVRDYVGHTESDNPLVSGDDLMNVDVVFAISASRKLTRSAARFTLGESSAGKKYQFTFSDDLSSSEERLHAYHADIPGLVALSAWDDRLKTPVHEFAHAMSSPENGYIFDEYVDRGHDASELESRLLVNKKFREKYKITDEALAGLHGESATTGMPDAVIDALDPLKTRPELGRAKFLEAVKGLIAADAETYKNTILKHADQSRFTLTEQALAKMSAEGLPEEVQALLRPKIGSMVTGRLKFIDLLVGTIGQDNTDVYQSIIIKFASTRCDPIPALFAVYEFDGKSVTYRSDRYLSDKHQSWTSYVPERVDLYSSCIMDVTYYRYHYDRLVFDFMYDRLTTKINRPN